MSLSQTIIFGMIFPLMFCSIGSLFARKGYVYFKAKLLFCKWVVSSNSLREML